MFIHLLVVFILIFIIPCIVIMQENKNIWLMRGNLYKNFGKKGIKFISIMFALSYIFLLGLRDGGGVDDVQYQSFYENGYGGSIFQLWIGKEPIFNILRLIGYYFNFNYKFLFLLYAILTGIFLGLSINNYFYKKSSCILYVAAYFVIAYTSMFTVMRQASAMAIIIYIYSLDDTFKFRKLLLWFLAIMCHYMAIVPFLISIFLQIFFPKKQAMPVTIKISLPIICLFMGLFLNLEGLINYIVTKFSLYSYMTNEANYLSSSNSSLVVSILFIIYIYRCLLIDRKQDCNGSKNSFLGYCFNNKIRICQMMYFCFYFLTIKMRWGNRISYYYLLFLPFLIVEFLYSFKFINLKITKVFTLCLLFICFAYVIYGVLGIKEYEWSFLFR